MRANEIVAKKAVTMLPIIFLIVRLLSSKLNPKPSAHIFPKSIGENQRAPNIK